MSGKKSDDNTPPDGYPVGNTDNAKRGREVAGKVIGQPIPEDVRRAATGQDEQS